MLNHNFGQWLGSGSYEYSKGIWRGMVSLNAAFNSFSYLYKDELYKNKTPEINLELTNRFKLFKRYTFSIEYQLTTSHDYLITKESYVNGFNVRLQRTWMLPNVLQLSVFANDVFNQNKNVAVVRYKTFYKKTESRSDLCRIGFSLSYFFKNYSKKYKGEETISQEMNRIKQ